MPSAHSRREDLIEVIDGLRRPPTTHHLRSFAWPRVHNVELVPRSEQDRAVRYLLGIQRGNLDRLIARRRPARDLEGRNIHHDAFVVGETADLLELCGAEC